MSTDKSKFRDRILKDAIITGVISSILFSFLVQPLFGTIWNYINQSSIKLYSTFNDRLFAAAALGYRNDSERTLLAVFAGLIWGFVFVSTVLVLGSRGIDSIRERIESTKSQKFFNSKAGKWIKKLVSLILVLYFAIFATRITYVSFVVYATTELNASFQQKLNALKPFLTEAEEEQLLSSWALMSSKNDYEEINTKMEDYASKNNFDLPPTLWPNVLWSMTAWP